MAIGSNGVAYSWGEGADGQLGNGGANKKVPVLVSMPGGVTAVAIAGGLDHSLAIGSDGNLYAWGVGGLVSSATGNTNVHPRCKCRSPSAHPPPRCSPARRLTAASPSLRRPRATTTLGSSASSVTYGQTVTLTATVSPTDGGGTVSS